jgi:hypothetical protein
MPAASVGWPRFSPASPEAQELNRITSVWPVPHCGQHSERSGVWVRLHRMPVAMSPSQILS